MKVKLGGQARELKYPYRSVEKYEQLSGKSIVISDSSTIGMTDIVNLIWAGLLWQDSRLQRNDVIGWLEAYRKGGKAPLELIVPVMQAIANDNWYGEEAKKLMADVLGAEQPTGEDLPVE